MGDLRVTVLGGLEATMDGTPVDLGGPKQRAVLALLLLARGGIVAAERIAEDLWRGEPPPRAAGALQAYVSHLRRALEPDRAPRAPARLLVSISPGYAVRLPAAQVDAWDFEDLVRQSARRAAEDPAGARGLLRSALELWAGAPYAPFADEEWATGEVARLHDLHSEAVEQLADCELQLGSPAEALSVLERHASAHPLRERAWALVATALYQTGRQADALAALRDLRRRLVDELGVDPGPEVQRLETAILGHDESLQRAAVTPSVAATATALVPAPSGGGPAEAVPRGEVFVGRDAELGRLTALAADAAAGTVRLCLVSGEPGAGKSALAAALAQALTGWRVLWGRCPEVEGAPPLYPWSQLVRDLPEQATAQEPDLGVLLDDRAAEPSGDVASRRFRLHRAVGRLLRSTAQQGPLLVVLDDVHRADDETLALLVDVVPDLVPVPVLVVTTHRPAEVGPGLAAALAALARHSPDRLELAGLDAADAAVLVRHASSADLPEGVVASIVDRTDGNPFYVREAARLAGASGSPDDGVPEGVRDVIGRRLARLPATAHTLLRMASLQGRQVDVDLLLAVTDLPEDEALDGLDSALVAGLVEEPEPGAVRFVHALVQETLYGEISLLRRARWHARLAEAVEELRPEDHAALAHHYRLAGAAYDAKVARYAALAAEQADRRHAFGPAETLWRQAIDAHGRLEDGALADLVDLWAGLIETLGHSGNTFAANTARREAIEVARPGGVRMVAQVIAAWDTPAMWTTHPYGEHDHPLITEAKQVVALLGDEPDTAALRARLLTVVGLETEGLADDVVDDAPRRAEALAREVGDPALLCAALETRCRHGHSRIPPAEADALALEVLEVARDHDLAIFQGLGHQLCQQRASAAGDLPGAVFHAGEMERLGRVYGLPGLVMVARQVPPLVAYARGDLEEAERLFAEFAAALAAVGALSVEIYRWNVDFLLAYARGQTGTQLDAMRVAEQACAPLQPLLVHALLSAGLREEATTVWRRRRPPTRDILWGFYAAVDADNAVVLGSPEERESSYRALSLISGELAAAATGFFVLPPVDGYLARLAASLGRHEDARRHWERAADLAARVDNPAWVAEARAGAGRAG